ncbi:DUF1294 domain-containing protein [Inhella sp.]|uniref:DUF1294 domain-containing protein n=1 Tax=Inhella sp. TaxID=1921806 RepID=UPI0035ADFD0C
MQFEGTVSSWNDERGFGFITARQGGQEIFFHIKAFQGRGARPLAGQPVLFDIELGPQGKKRASRVEPVRQRSVRPTSARASAAQWGTATLFALPAFLVLTTAIAVLWGLPRWVLIGYASLIPITFFAYSHDKAQAQSGGRRVSESTLHALAVLGGWPGGLLAQQLLRHKSVKREFRQVFWTVTVINVLTLIALCSPWGQQLLQL